MPTRSPLDRARALMQGHVELIEKDPSIADGTAAQRGLQTFCFRDILELLFKIMDRLDKMDEKGTR